jgi:hypothetical protein
MNMRGNFGLRFNGTAFSEDAAMRENDASRSWANCFIFPPSIITDSFIATCFESLGIFGFTLKFNFDIYSL